MGVYMIKDCSLCVFLPALMSAVASTGDGKLVVRAEADRVDSTVRFFNISSSSKVSTASSKGRIYQARQLPSVKVPLALNTLAKNGEILKGCLLKGPPATLSFGPRKASRFSSELKGSIENKDSIAISFSAEPFNEYKAQV